MKQKFLALAASYFKHYPKENTIFFTEDKQAFFAKNDATNHAKSLRKKESDEPVVIEVSREEAEAGATEEKPSKPAGKGSAKSKTKDATGTESETGTEGGEGTATEEEPAQ